ncbi:hypothetical protein ACSVDE_14495 [Pseudalkalibacillus sp. Hm43]|uniref:hypothetical protein n=1 Tax=Pseudalkalibacillus sp. Hm43 TaxID=3450742 RepID=UPI003F42C4DB
MKTKEIDTKEYHSIGNELKLFGFGIGEDIHNINKAVEGTVEEEELYYEFPKHELRVYLNPYKKSHFISTTNPEFEILDETALNMTKEDVMAEFSEYDLHEFVFGFGEDNPEDTSYIYFSVEKEEDDDKQKVVLKFNQDRVESVFLGTEDVPFHQIIEPGVEEDDLFTDDELMVLSKYLTLDVDLGLNNKKVLSKEFMQYAQVGLLEGMPFPLGFSKDDLINRFELPNTVTAGSGMVKQYYYYTAYNAYLGFTQEDEESKELLTEIVIPVDLPIEEMEERYDFKDKKMGEYSISIVTEEERVVEVILTLADPFDKS